MEKEFNKWNEIKFKLEENKKVFLFNEWEIWWCSLGLNIRQESCWKWESFRSPILVLKKLSATAFIWIPLSSQIKKWTWFVNYFQNEKQQTALLHQIRMLDINRLQRKMWEIDSNDFLSIKKRNLKKQLKLYK